MKKFAIVLAALMLTLSACGAPAATTSSTPAASSTQSEAVQVEVPENWPAQLPAPNVPVLEVWWSDNDGAVEITMGTAWTLETAQAYADQCMEAGMELWGAVNTTDGTYRMEGLVPDGSALLTITCGDPEAIHLSLIYIIT